MDSDFTYISNQYRCLQCETGFMLFSNKCLKIASTCINDSVPYSLQGALDFVGCVGQDPKYIANCDYYSSTGVCMYCSIQFYLQGNACIPRTTDDLANCIAYGLNKCILCDNGKVADDGTCTSGVTTIDNCVMATPDLTVCLRCAETYTWNGTVCAQPITDCGLYSSANSCSCCATGKSLVNNLCKTPDLVKDNCLCQVDRTCSVCVEGYFLIDGDCVQKDGGLTGCAARSQLANAVCVQCESGF